MKMQEQKDSDVKILRKLNSGNLSITQRAALIGQLSGNTQEKLSMQMTPSSLDCFRSEGEIEA
jgi:hypothetical protein